jgi:hypothetical protein
MCILCISVSKGSAQVKFEKGYFINNNGVKKNASLEMLIGYITRYLLNSEIQTPYVFTMKFAG